MRIASVGHAVFAAVFVALGIRGLVTGHFTAVWQPVPKGTPAREALIYVCAVLSLASGAGLLWKRSASVAARALLAALVLWVLLFRLRDIVHAPAAIDSWDGCAETIGVTAGAWVLYAWFSTDWDKRRLAFAASERGVHIARILLGLAFIPFGLAHFAFIHETASLVPRWLPAHLAWAYLTGGAFLAAAIALLTGVYARLAAALSTFQIGLFTLLVWVPVVAGGSKDAFVWSEFGISTALTAAAWVVADSYRDTPWLALRARGWPR